MKNYIGNKYNRWTILQFSHIKNRRYYYKCKCDCGNTNIIDISSVVNGRSKSCGCYKREVDAEKGRKMLTKHNLSNTKIWKKWVSIINRCYDKNQDNYYLYGGRGIKVCDEWKSNFVKFYNWAISNGYKDGLTIDRIDVNGNYEPNNCRFITMQEQHYNKRDTIYIFNNGVKYTINDLYKTYGVDKKKIRDRYYKGMKFEDIIYNGNLRYKI